MRIVARRCLSCGREYLTAASAAERHCLRCLILKLEETRSDTRPTLPELPEPLVTILAKTVRQQSQK